MTRMNWTKVRTAKLMHDHGVEPTKWEGCVKASPGLSRAELAECVRPKKKPERKSGKRR